MSRASIYLCLASVSLGVFAAACVDPQVPPPISLDGPTRMAVGRACLVDEEEPRRRVAVERCEEGGDLDGTLQEYAYVTNKLGNSLAVASFNQSIPSLIDVNRAVPGVTHVPVGQYPTDVVVSADGNFIFTLNEVGQDISVVAHSQLREVARIPVGQGFSSLLGLKERNTLLYMTPSDKTLHLIDWSFTCDGSEEYNTECEPEITHDARVLYTFPDRWSPTRFTLGAAADRLYVTFANRPTLGVFLLDNSEQTGCIDGRSAPPCLGEELPLTYGCSDLLDNDGDGLIDAEDPQCLTPDSSESDLDPGLNLVSVCSDGIDNDGDGFADATDSGCTHPSDLSETDALKAIECSDGIDNDGDGLEDAFDPECTNLALGTWNPWHVSEGRRPRCSDGLDNDGDGATDFPADTACADPDYDTEAVVAAAANECTDGIDNDLDGAIDLDDPACSNPANTTERQGVAVCSDGIDNDGDGLADYPEDPDCYSAAGTTEEKRVVNEYGPVAIDPEGLFAYVVDRTISQVLIIDLKTGELLNANQDVPSDSRLGVPVGRLPLAITARQRELDLEESEDGSTRITRKVAFANVAASRGVAYYIEAADYYRSYEGEAEEPTQEVRNLLLQLADASSSDPSSSSINCNIDDDFIARVREARDDPSADVSCEAEEIPQIPMAEVEAGEEEPEEVNFLTVDRDTLVLDDSGQVAEEVDTQFRDYRIAEDRWTITYEGTIVERSDTLVDEQLPSIIRSQGGDFCSSGAEAGDILSITSDPTPLGDGTNCSAYEGVDLLYRITSVQSNQLVIATLTADEVANLNRTNTETAVVDRLPSRECFARGMTIEVQPEGEWVVAGERIGLLVNSRGVSGVCVPRYDWEQFAFRARSGERFENPYFSFDLTEGTVTPTQGFEYRFRVTSNGFRSLVFAVGPTSSDIHQIDTASGSYLSVVDAGTNVIRVYEAETLRLLNFLF
ncbi:MAG: hypothetical protein CMH57_12145 [Myxococcales bacterium]|nr:hypothetical protein [Myxococcales bacterium]